LIEDTSVCCCCFFFCFFFVFYESPNSEVSQLGFEKINSVDFLGLKILHQVFLIKNLIVLAFDMLEKNLIFYDQEVLIDSFWEIFMES
jgi:hypothetical protein